MRKSEGDQHKKAGGLIVDWGWMATEGASSGVLSASTFGSIADPNDDGPVRLLS